MYVCAHVCLIECSSDQPSKTITTTTERQPLLCTTPELYHCITTLLCKQPELYEKRKMDVNQVVSPLYEVHIKELKDMGRMINPTKSDGNCLYRSLCKGLIGRENKHYTFRCILFSFISMNSEIFIPHIKQKHGTTTTDDYCTAMSTDGVWGTDIEILAAATILQAPIYTYSCENSNKYRWLRYLPLSIPEHIHCDYDETLKQLVFMAKPAAFHVELFHFESRHYDLITSICQTPLQLPSLSSFTCDITIS